MSSTHILLQYGEDFRNMRFENLEGKLAFSLQTVEENPNLILRLARETSWAEQHPSILGPTSSFLYFGPARTQGYLVYGNSASQSMANSMRQKSTSSTSRYFSAQNGAEYKWRLGASRFECVDSKGALLAVWELASPGDEFQARLTIKYPALGMITELITTLILNRIGQSLSW